MKKMIALVLALVTGSCVMSFGKSADDYDSRVTVMQRGDVFKVIYDSPGLNKVEVKIYDESGNIVFSEKLNSRSGFIRPYNFEKMPEGDYNISVVDESGEYTEKICSRTQKPNTLWAAHVDKLRGRWPQVPGSGASPGEQRYHCSNL